MEAIITSKNAHRWAAALNRAIAEALDVLVATDGSAFVESSSQPGLIYSVSREACTCPAGAQGQPCKHRACYLAQIGELEIEPDPASISFTGNSDRQEIRIDGEIYGDAVATEYGGWDLFRGRFPNARLIGSFCTLDEIERDLAARLPVTLQVPPAVLVEDLATAAA